jgi:hypothetical protein
MTAGQQRGERGITWEQRELPELGWPGSVPKRAGRYLRRSLVRDGFRAIGGG